MTRPIPQSPKHKHEAMFAISEEHANAWLREHVVQQHGVERDDEMLHADRGTSLQEAHRLSHGGSVL